MSGDAPGKSDRTIEYWGDRWTTGKTGWHQPAPDAQLVSLAPRLLPPPHKQRVFLPLCGKSLDMLWLYQEGHEVVGVEGVESVVQEFGDEHGIAFDVTTLPWCKQYKSPDGRLTVHVCDLFQSAVAEMGRFDAIYDRGSLVAINVVDRSRYAHLLKQLLQPQFRYLLSAVDYTPTDDFAGPPCAISFDEVVQLFGDVANCELVLENDKSEETKFKNTGVGKFTELFILMSSK